MSPESSSGAEPLGDRGGPAGPVPGLVPDRNADRKANNDAWAASGLLMSGVIVWGGAGYLVSEWLGNQLFTMVGLLTGTGTALYGIWSRYGRG